MRAWFLHPVTLTGEHEIVFFHEEILILVFEVGYLGGNVNLLVFQRMSLKKNPWELH